MVYGTISDEDFLSKKCKIIMGVAGSGKSTQAVNNLRRLGVEDFCLASFSNSLKFAASDKFVCECDTICGCCFINNPRPRAEFKNITEYSTVIIDECLLDGMECIEFIKSNIGRLNLIVLTDKKQMLNSENSDKIIEAFDELCSMDDVIVVELMETKRARTDETKDMYEMLYTLDSNTMYDLPSAIALLQCSVMNFEDVKFNTKDSFICHSNKIEHQIYMSWDLTNVRNNQLIPKNHISRKRDIDFDKYPILDQITAVEKNVSSYCQHHNVGTPTRYQGKEINVGDMCYFVVEPDSYFTARELYTVATRCQDIRSLKIVLISVCNYDDPKQILNTPVVEAKTLDIPNHDKQYRFVKQSDMVKIIKEYGNENEYYKTDVVTSGEYIIYSTMNNSVLSKFADVFENEDGSIIVKYRKKTGGAKKSIKSITRKDTTMHFDYIPKVYDIVKCDVTPPRIINKNKKSRKDFEKLCDIFSAFPTVLHNAPMPKAGLIYEEYNENLLNFYIYEGSIVKKGSLITEELADILGESRYVFSTDKQIGCELGHYTYKQCKISKEKKARINKDMVWGKLESNYYEREVVVLNGKECIRYVKNPRNTLELVSCAVWSSLCSIMLNAVKSIDAKDFVVVTDGIYYDGDKIPTLPEWCDFRIENKTLEKILGKDPDSKYDNIEYKTYVDPPSDRLKKQERDNETRRTRRANMTEEEREAIRAKDRERKRLAKLKKEQ